MLEIKDITTFSLKSSLTLKNILGETYFLLDSETGKQYDLTELEYQIVYLISKSAKFIDIVNEIANEYDEQKNIIKQDVREYIEEMVNAGLIV